MHAISYVHIPLISRNLNSYVFVGRGSMGVEFVYVKWVGVIAVHLQKIYNNQILLMIL